MNRISSDEIRNTFLEFFERHGHQRIPGSSVVPRNDPTLLFINSGMAPLKKYFTGEEAPPASDLCNVQACIRTKDIDDVGDRHHLTFFEMMGSWSIGNYFKDRAIELAYELVTDGLKLDPSRLYVTVFAGDPVLGLPPDEESAKAWERVGISRDHIVALPAEDNFWGPAGTSGPCGPCTEVFLDTGEEFGPAYVPGGEFDTTRRYIEIWNAGVFMQFNKEPDGTFRPLSFTSVDTGSGLERMELALNGLGSVYESDLIAPVVSAVQASLGETGTVLDHHRLIADHMRAAAIIMADGAYPGNEGQNYIPRRLLRKCVTVAMGRGHGSFDYEPVLETIVDRLGDYYPNLGRQHRDIALAIQTERDDFGKTVQRGIERLEALTAKSNHISGTDAFQLFSTYGLPVEITRDLAAERSVSVSLDEFAEEFQRHQERSRGGATDRSGSDRLKPNDPLPASLMGVGGTEFVGYDHMRAEARVLAILEAGEVVDDVVAGSEMDVFVDVTPCYSEGGGQVGDHGRIDAPHGSGRITATFGHHSGRTVHRVIWDSGTLSLDDVVTISVETAARARTAANHSATHLLNAALRTVLGDGVRQAGSLVEPERLRFDFTHSGAMTPDEIASVERLVNEAILADLERTVEHMSPDSAHEAGALSLPGEAYGPDVRVVSFGTYSKELCGGTHVDRTSQLGSFRITSEQSVASGVRRINAVTRDGAIEFALSQHALLHEVSAILKSNHLGAPDAARRLTARAARKPASDANGAGVSSVRETLRSEVDGLPILVCESDGDVRLLRERAQALSEEHGGLVVVWNADADERAGVAVSTSTGDQPGVNAADIVRAMTGTFGGSGGGKAAVAQGAMAKSPDRVDFHAALLDAIVPATSTAPSPGESR